MPNLPIRGLGVTGVITDVEPFNLPINAFDRALNVRFADGAISRSPVFRSLLSSVSFTPALAFGIFKSIGYDSVLLVSDRFKLHELSNNTLTDRSGAIGTLSASAEASLTATVLSDVTYVNREDRVPVFRGPNGTNFADLTFWPNDYRAKALRTYGDFLVALNTDESGISFPNRVRFSDLALPNQIPTSWDESDPTKSAGTNDIIQMETPIVDGLSLSTNFIIYSSDQVWLMEFVGGAFIHNFRKIFSSCGVISQNCLVEVQGKHYVFDTDDIWSHDGTTKESLVDDRIRAYIFDALDNSATHHCFVYHNHPLSEIYFCYPSSDDMTTDRPAFAPVGANRAAVYNYRYNTWSFMDLPHVVSATTANINSVRTYDTTTLAYATTGGTYAAQDAGFDRHAIMASIGNNTEAVNAAGRAITVPKLYGVDLSDNGSLSQPLDTVATASPFVERTGIDLDEVEIPLSGYKVITKITPQVVTTNSSKTFDFTFGSAPLAPDVPNYGDKQTIDISTDYKLDTRQGGRYLSYKMTLDNGDNKDFALSGFDLDVVVTGRR